MRIAGTLVHHLPKMNHLMRRQIAYTQPMLEALGDALRCSPADLIMRDPTAPNSIWSIWDQIPPTQRNQAFRILETFAKKTGTDD